MDKLEKRISIIKFIYWILKIVFGFIAIGVLIYGFIEKETEIMIAGLIMIMIGMFFGDK